MDKAQEVSFLKEKVQQNSQMHPQVRSVRIMGEVRVTFNVLEKKRTFIEFQ